MLKNSLNILFPWAKAYGENKIKVGVIVHLCTGMRKEFFEGFIISFVDLSKYCLYTESNVEDKSNSNFCKDFSCDEF